MESENFLIYFLSFVFQIHKIVIKLVYVHVGNKCFCVCLLGDCDVWFGEL